MALRRRLSTLELTVMGILWKTGGATAYAVTQEFTHSQTSAYRSGAGAIYPLLKRLVAAGLASGGGQGGLFRLTDAGLAALQGWFATPLDEDEFSCLLDPLRSRIYFFRSIPVDQRRRFLEDAVEGLKGLAAKCERIRRAYEASGDPFSALAAAGALAETRARMRWLRKAASELPE